MKSIEIDRNKALIEEPSKGHNRWHPDIRPVIEVDEGEEVVLETRETSDRATRPGMTAAEAQRRPGLIHPLTGPVFVKGAEPGDLLEVEYLDIVPGPWGFTRCGPGIGFLPDLLDEPLLAHWDIADGWATSQQVPGVRIADGCFMGTAGVAPSREQLVAWTKREAALVERGGRAMLPESTDAVPNGEPFASEGLRTAPPRENCGNVDAKQLTRGSKLFLPVSVPGALYSAGDGHFAQGDGEACITAIEMDATVSVRFRLHKGEAARKNIRWPRFSHADYFQPAQWAAPKIFIATMGMPVTNDGVQENGDLNLAARNALLNMIDVLQERGYSPAQAYIICSVAVDLRISNLVDAPNYTVSAFLSEDIFRG
jgi:formamidase